MDNTPVYKIISLKSARKGKKTLSERLLTDADTPRAIKQPSLLEDYGIFLIPLLFQIYLFFYV